MQRLTHLLVLFVVALLIGVLHHSAFVFFWYWSYWWFDIVMHFLGGLFIGLSVLWVNRHFFSSGILAGARSEWLTVIALVVVVAGLWELFELWGNISFVDEPGFGLDTTIDLCVGLGGGITGLIVSVIGRSK